MKRRVMAAVLLPMALLAAACGDDGGSDTSTAAATTTPAATGAAATGAASAATTTAAKAGGTYAIVLPSSKDDKSFSQAGYTGAKEAADAIGGKLVFQENVAVASAQEAIRNMAAQKPKVVMTLGGQFADATAAVAPEFPDVHFVAINGTKTGANLSKWSLAEGEVAYLGGVLVASLNPDVTKIGRVGGAEIAPLKFGTAGFIDGARTVKPTMEYVSQFTGDFDDVAKAKEATLAAFKSGAKFVYSGMNNGIAGQEQAADEAGGKLISNAADQCAKKQYWAAAASNTPASTKSIVLGVGDGSLKPGFSKSGLEVSDGFILKLCSGSIPSDVQTKIDAAKADLVSGKVVVGLEPKK